MVVEVGLEIGGVEMEQLTPNATRAKLITTSVANFFIVPVLVLVPIPAV